MQVNPRLAEAVQGELQAVYLVVIAEEVEAYAGAPEELVGEVVAVDVVVAALDIAEVEKEVGVEGEVDLVELFPGDGFELEGPFGHEVELEVVGRDEVAVSINDVKFESADIGGVSHGLTENVGQVFVFGDADLQGIFVIQALDDLIVTGGSEGYEIFSIVERGHNAKSPSLEIEPEEDSGKGVNDIIAVIVFKAVGSGEEFQGGICAFALVLHAQGIFGEVIGCESQG